MSNLLVTTILLLIKMSIHYSKINKLKNVLIQEGVELQELSAILEPGTNNYPK